VKIVDAVLGTVRTIDRSVFSVNGQTLCIVLAEANTIYYDYQEDAGVGTLPTFSGTPLERDTIDETLIVQSAVTTDRRRALALDAFDDGVSDLLDRLDAAAKVKRLWKAK
jgi:hypothetical protein